MKELCCAFAGRLLTEVNGRKLFSLGQKPDGQGVFHNFPEYEFGWCGQNGMYSRLFLERGLKACEEPDGPYMYAAMLESDLEEVKKLESAGDFDGMYGAAAGFGTPLLS